MHRVIKRTLDWNDFPLGLFVYAMDGLALSLTNWLEFRYRMNKFFFNLRMSKNGSLNAWKQSKLDFLFSLPLPPLLTLAGFSHKLPIWENVCDTWNRAKQKKKAIQNGPYEAWLLLFYCCTTRIKIKQSQYYEHIKGAKNTNNVIIWKSMSFLPIYNNNNGNNRLFFLHSFIYWICITFTQNTIKNVWMGWRIHARKRS